MILSERHVRLTLSTKPRHLYLTVVKKKINDWHDFERKYKEKQKINDVDKVERTRRTIT